MTAPAQPGMLLAVTPVSVYTNVPITALLWATVTTLLPAPVVTVCGAPPFTLYVKVYVVVGETGAPLPVNVIVEVVAAFWAAVALPLIAPASAFVTTTLNVQSVLLPAASCTRNVTRDVPRLKV